MKEVWKPVAGYEGLYEISNKGRVRSSHRKNHHYMREYVNWAGYPYYALSRNKRRKQIFTHRMLAEAFLKRPEGTTDVNHIDGNKKNNDLSNLEWCTRQENIIHAFKLGLMKRGKGEKASKSKLSDDDVRKIKKLIIEGNLYFKEIGELFGVAEPTIAHINNENTWSHIEWPDDKRKARKGGRYMNESLVSEIKRTIKTTSLRNKEIAEKYGVSEGAIEKIKYNVTWKHVK